MFYSAARISFLPVYWSNSKAKTYGYVVRKTEYQCILILKYET